MPRKALGEKKKEILLGGMGLKKEIQKEGFVQDTPHCLGTPQILPLLLSMLLKSDYKNVHFRVVSVEAGHKFYLGCTFMHCFLTVRVARAKHPQP